jgi:gluconokinase
MVTVIIVMGVSGSGKTTLGSALARRLGWEFAEADDFHSAANIAKMREGRALDDADRMPWLQAIAQHIDDWRRADRCGVITCSALKRSYRELVVGDRADVRLVFLKGSAELIASRLMTRKGHFMPASLLGSQIDTLEEPAPDEHAIALCAAEPIELLVAEIVTTLGLDR